MTDRIRWERTKAIHREPADRSGWTGYVGTLKPCAFEVWQSGSDFSDVTLGEWVLSIRLPGPLSEQLPHGHDPEKLKAEAERWLEEFVSSLGAIFPPEPDQRTALQLIEARSILARWDAEQEPKPVIERVLADQVKALLVIAEPAVTAATTKGN